MISPSRLEEREDDAYSQGFSEGFEAARAQVKALLTRTIEARPWPMVFGWIIDIDDLQEKISDLTP